MMRTSERYKKLKGKPINQDTFFVEWPEGGLSAMNSPYDPKPSIVIKNGVIVEMDGRQKESFDSIEHFIANYGINIENAGYAMGLEAKQIARMIVDIHVNREEVIQITTAITPAKMLEVVKCLNAVETMMGQMKMRIRKIPANQAHVTNIRDHPVLLAADAAEAALRGFSEIETTCAVSRYAPFNAMAIMIGSLSVRPGVLTQCAMEESLEVRMGMAGLTSYAETVSLYGTEEAMDDGDDTVWSKAFLTSIYASRGMKMRCTSGTGAEVLLGHSKSKSMLYLEILCVFMARACGIQGVQNGSISCIGITSAVPNGFLAIAAENLVVSLLDLEVASGNDQTFSHSDMRRTAKLLMQMLPGTDFVTSGYSAVPNFDDVFAGSNTDCDDYDDYYMIQRDMQVDGGIEPITEECAIAVRNRAAKACQSVFLALGLPVITDEEVENATYAYSNEEMPDRNMPMDLAAAQEFTSKGITAIHVAKALQTKGFTDIAENILNMMKQRICGDYLQVSAIFDKNLKIVSGLNCRNDYTGPGTGYRISEERWEKLKVKTSALIPETILDRQGREGYASKLRGVSEEHNAEPGEVDIIIGVSPAFANKRIGDEISRNHYKIISEISKAIEDGGNTVQIVKIYHTSDLTEIALMSARLSISGIGVGVQSNGRICITNSNKALNNGIEAFYNMPLSDYSQYQQIGIYASLYARGKEPEKTEELRTKRPTNYQLQMLGFSAEERQFVNKNKKPCVLTFDCLK